MHCNAFLPVYLLLYVLQYLLLPLLLRPGFVAVLLSNSLYAIAFSIYHYLTFLGYSVRQPRRKDPSDAGAHCAVIACHGDRSTAA